MGKNCSSMYQKAQKEWKIVSQSNNSYILKNLHMKVQVEKHSALTKMSIENKDDNLYQWRKSNKGQSNILEIFYYQISKHQNLHDFCNGIEERQIHVFSEILKPIEKEQNISNYLGLQLLSDFINGAINLKQKFGFFRIKKKMIGLNDKKIGKVWINSNFAKNQPQFIKGTDKKYDDSMMVSDICAIVSKKISFSKELYGKNLIEAKNYIYILKKANRTSSNIQIDRTRQQSRHSQDNIKKIKLSEKSQTKLPIDPIHTHQTNLSADIKQNNSFRPSIFIPYPQLNKFSDLPRKNTNQNHSFYQQSTLNTSINSFLPNSSHFLSSNQMINSNQIHPRSTFKNNNSVIQYKNDTFIKDKKNNRNSNISINGQGINRIMLKNDGPIFPTVNIGNLTSYRKNDRTVQRTCDLTTRKQQQINKTKKVNNSLQNKQANETIAMINSMIMVNQYEESENQDVVKIEESVIIRGLNQ